MKNITILLKPASSSCNYNCRYCFYYDIADNRSIKNYGIIQPETIDNLLDKVFNFFNEKTQINFAFQGGEPTVAPISTFKYFIQQVQLKKKEFHHIGYSIQTNGSMINDEWINLFKQYNFLVGISLDGFKENHNYFRLIKNKPTFNEVMKTINLLQKNNIQYNILTVLTNKLAQHPVKLFNFIKKNNFNFVQLIPCLPKIATIQDEFSLTPKKFFEFYQVFFDLWFNEYQNNNYISINLFNDIFNILQNKLPGSCGALGFCSFQFIVEANGNVYPCDFYVLDEYNLGNINQQSFEEIISNPLINQFLHRKKRDTKLCHNCKYVNICHGQCPRLNVCYFNDDYCGYQKLLDHIITSIN